MIRTNRVWRLRRRPEGDLADGDLELCDEPVEGPGDGEVLIRTLYLSIDPTNRIWMSDVDQYLPPVEIGAPMRGVTLAEVVESGSDRFSQGDIVMPQAGEWALYQTLPERMLSRVPVDPNVPLSAYMSVLGPPGLTSWAGLVEVAELAAGETVTISAAAGAVGSVAGQIAKARGARVIGIAGGPTKCGWLTDTLGFDGAVDYKSDDVDAALERLCPDGVDVHFENVGGAILDAAIRRMKIGGRIALCGLISSYNEGGATPGPTEFQRVLMQRITLKGFIVLDHFKSAKTAYGEIAGLIRDGSLIWKDHVLEGIEQAPGAVAMLFAGKNDGKLMIRL